MYTGGCLQPGLWDAYIGRVVTVGSPPSAVIFILFLVIVICLFVIYLIYIVRLNMEIEIHFPQLKLS